MSTGPIARARMYTFEEPLDVLVTERSSHSITYIQGWGSTLVGNGNWSDT